jgi:hypothetical protein
VPAVTTATWELATVASVTLSGGNLVATNTGTTSTNQGARVATTSGKTTGLYYYECTITTKTGAINGSIGVGTTASTYTNMGNGGTAGVVMYWQSGNIWANGSSASSTLGVLTNGQVAGIAIDLGNRKAWFRIAPSGNWNGSGTANPATNTGGITIPAGTMVPFVTFGGSPGSANNVITANFGASAFSGAVPSGFTSGWPA